MLNLLVPAMLLGGTLFGYPSLLLLTPRDPFLNGFLNPRINCVQGYASGGPKWVFDSGCTHHMTGGKEMLDQFIEDVNRTSYITFGDNSKGKVLGVWQGGNHERHVSRECHAC